MSTLLQTLANAQPYRRMLGKLLPRGPLWDLVSQSALLALVDGLAEELKRIHNRLVDLRAEADPRTASELLDEWCAAWGVTEIDNASLLAQVTATGGQSIAYFERLAYTIQLAPPDYAPLLPWVTIEERPYGRTFRAWSGKAWEPANGTPAEFYWVMHLPTVLPPAQSTAIEAIVQRYKPAHTIVSFEYDLLI